MISNKNSFKHDLPKTMRIHNAFPVLQHDQYTPPAIGQRSLEPHAVMVNDSEEWQVARILDSMQRHRKLHYLIQRSWYNHICTSWEPLEYLENPRELVEEFQRDHPNKLWRYMMSDHGIAAIDGMERWRVRTFVHFPLSISFCWDLVQCKWRRHGFYHLWKSS